tara:strand:+ start:317 stop:808 length:492 start_codon:yes stop_codon:yes gene_type:complete
MELKQYSKDELMDFLTNGIPMPETALTNENTIDFYFEELESFINVAENEFWAKSTDKNQLTVSFGSVEYLIIRMFSDNLFLLMAPSIADDINNITQKEAENVIGLVYGIIVYNYRWEEISEMALDLLKTGADVPKIGDGGPIKINSIEMKNLKKFIEENKKYE